MFQYLVSKDYAAKLEKRVETVEVACSDEELSDSGSPRSPKALGLRLTGNGAVGAQHSAAPTKKQHSIKSTAQHSKE